MLDAIFRFNISSNPFIADRVYDFSLNHLWLTLRIILQKDPRYSERDICKASRKACHRWGPAVSSLLGDWRFQLRLTARGVPGPLALRGRQEASSCLTTCTQSVEDAHHQPHYQLSECNRPRNVVSRGTRNSQHHCGNTCCFRDNISSRYKKVTVTVIQISKTRPCRSSNAAAMPRSSETRSLHSLPDSGKRCGSHTLRPHTFPALTRN